MGIYSKNILIFPASQTNM